MIEERPITLILKPHNQPVKATIVTLTPELADQKVMGGWWHEDCLKDVYEPPIDSDWDWNNYELVFEDIYLEFEKVAVITGEGEDLAVQGAMLVSTEPVDSVDDGQPCLLLELLFTAPRNRKNLRKDGQPFLVGVGTELLTWAAWLSREKGYGGRLRLDSSPDFVKWYERNGLHKLNLDPIVYEETTYTPMELSADDAEKLLSEWEEDER